MKIKTFEELNIWKESIDLIDDLYLIFNKKWLKNDFWLIDQMRRACVSISSNIAEWYERNNNNELIRFLVIAKWSSWELRSQLYICLKLKYITNDEYFNIHSKLIAISKQIWWFISYLKNKKNEWEFINK